MKKVALQLYSIRDLMAQNVFATLKECKKAGYSGVEFAGYFDVSATDMKNALDDNGLVAAGTHSGLALLSDETIESTIEYNLTIGNRNIVCPGMPKEMLESEDAVKKTAEQFNKIGEKMSQNGLRFYYHNHHWEFETIGEQTKLELLFANTEPRNLGMELDVYWAVYANADPIAIMNRYQNRCSLLHIKDMLPGEEKRCTEAGRGIIDYEKIVTLGKKYDVDWYVIEQESFDIPELESIAINAQWLNEHV